MVAFPLRTWSRPGCWGDCSALVRVDGVGVGEAKHEGDLADTARRSAQEGRRVMREERRRLQELC